MALLLRKGPTAESSLASDSDPSDSGSSTADDAYCPRGPLKLGTTEAYLMSSPFFLGIEPSLLQRLFHW